MVDKEQYSLPDAGSAEFDPLEDSLNRRSIFPPFGLIIATILIVGGIIAMHSASASLEDAMPVIDKGAQFIISVLLVMVLAIVYLIWFAFFCGISGWLRAIMVLLAIGGLAAFLICVEPLQNKGSLWPTGFKLRSDPYADETLAKLESNTDVQTTSQLAFTIEPDQANTHFHQYFGPKRDGNIPVSLASDWSNAANAPKQIWKHEIGAGWSGFSAAKGFALTMEQRGEQEYTSCYNIQTGEVVWAHAENARHHSALGGIGPRSTPTIDPQSGNVYSSGATGILICLKGDDGSLLWRKNIVEEVGSTIEQDLTAVTWGRSASPLIVGDKVIVVGGGAITEQGKPASGTFDSLIAYDKSSGEELWRGGNEQIGYSSPSLANFHGTDMIVITNEASVTGHDIETGKQLWWHVRPGSSNAGANTSQPVFLPNNQILLSKGYGLGGELILIEKTDDGFATKQVWQNNRSLRTKMTSAVTSGDYAYSLSDEILECIKLKSGKRAWRAGRFGHGQMLLADNVLLIVTEDGELVAVAAKPEGLKELGRIAAVEGVTWNIPCLHKFDGKWYLIIRNAEQVVCFVMKTDGGSNDATDTESETKPDA